MEIEFSRLRSICTGISKMYDFTGERIDSVIFNNIITDCKVVVGVCYNNDKIDSYNICISNNGIENRYTMYVDEFAHSCLMFKSVD